MTLSTINSSGFEVDSLPTAAGAVDAVRRGDDSFGAHYNQYLRPYVFNYSEFDRDPVFPCAGEWIVGDWQNTAIIAVEFLDERYARLSGPVVLPEQFTINVRAAYFRVVGVLSAGHFRYQYGYGPTFAPAIIGGSLTQGMTLQFSDCESWTTYDPLPVCDLSGAVLKVSPVQCGIGNFVNQIRQFDTANTLTTSHWDFIQWGYAVLDADPELEGTVTGGIYVRDFAPIMTFTTPLGQRIQPWMYPAVLCKRSAGGVSASATIPNRHFQAQGQRLYVRSSKLFQKA